MSNYISVSVDNSVIRKKKILYRQVHTHIHTPAAVVTMTIFMMMVQGEVVTPKGGGSMDLWSAGILPHHYTASQPRRPQLETSPPLSLIIHTMMMMMMMMIKVKLSLCFNWTSRHEGVLGEWKHSSTHSWPRHWMEVNGQLRAPAALPTGREPLVPIG
jgi:hypothetical protein